MRPDAGSTPCASAQTPCLSDTECGPGRRCLFHAEECNPSACACDLGTDSLICTADCGGRRCTLVDEVDGGVDAGSSFDAGTGNPVDAGAGDAGLCASFEPPCSSNTQCRSGTTCQHPAGECAPSACACDPMTGHVVCTTDCNGRRCLP